MKGLMVTAAAAVIYLLVSIFTGWWAVTWIIWVFYGIYMIAVQIRKNLK